MTFSQVSLSFETRLIFFKMFYIVQSSSFSVNDLTCSSGRRQRLFSVPPASLPESGHCFFPTCHVILTIFPVVFIWGRNKRPYLWSLSISIARLALGMCSNKLTQKNFGEKMKFLTWCTYDYHWALLATIRTQIMS